MYPPPNVSNPLNPSTCTKKAKMGLSTHLTLKVHLSFCLYYTPLNIKPPIFWCQIFGNSPGKALCTPLQLLTLWAGIFYSQLYFYFIYSSPTKILCNIKYILAKNNKKMALLIADASYWLVILDVYFIYHLKNKVYNLKLSFSGTHWIWRLYWNLCGNLQFFPPHVSWYANHGTAESRICEGWRC